MDPRELAERRADYVAKRPTACLPCRFRKRKCDGKQPICTQCVTVQSRRPGEQCVYADGRRKRADTSTTTSSSRRRSSVTSTLPTDPALQRQLLLLYNLLRKGRYLIIPNRPNSKAVSFDTFLRFEGDDVDSDLEEDQHDYVGEYDDHDDSNMQMMVDTVKDLPESSEASPKKVHLSESSFTDLSEIIIAQDGSQATTASPPESPLDGAGAVFRRQALQSRPSFGLRAARGTGVEAKTASTSTTGSASGSAAADGSKASSRGPSRSPSQSATAAGAAVRGIVGGSDPPFVGRAASFGGGEADPFGMHSLLVDAGGGGADVSELATSYRSDSTTNALGDRDDDALDSLPLSIKTSPPDASPPWADSPAWGAAAMLPPSAAERRASLNAGRMKAGADPAIMMGSAAKPPATSDVASATASAARALPPSGNLELQALWQILQSQAPNSSGSLGPVWAVDPDLVPSMLGDPLSLDLKLDMQPYGLVRPDTGLATVLTILPSGAQGGVLGTSGVSSPSAGLGLSNVHDGLGGQQPYVTLPSSTLAPAGSVFPQNPMPRNPMPRPFAGDPYHRPLPPNSSALAGLLYAESPEVRAAVSGMFPIPLAAQLPSALPGAFAEPPRPSPESTSPFPSSAAATMPTITLADVPDSILFHLTCLSLLHVQGLFPMFHIPSFIIDLGDRRHHESLLMSMCALGTLYTPDIPELSQPPFFSRTRAGEMFAKRADLLIAAARGTADECIDMVQSLIMLALYSFGTVNPIGTYHASLAVAMAKRGLYDQPSNPNFSTLSKFTYEVGIELPFTPVYAAYEELKRRRTWVCVFAIDSITCWANKMNPLIDETTQLHLLYEDGDLEWRCKRTPGQQSPDQARRPAEPPTPSSADLGWTLAQQEQLELVWPRWMAALLRIFNSAWHGPLPSGYPWIGQSAGASPTPSPDVVTLDAGFLPSGYEHMIRMLFLVRRIVRYGGHGGDGPAALARYATAHGLRAGRTSAAGGPLMMSGPPAEPPRPPPGASMPSGARASPSGFLSRQATSRTLANLIGMYLWEEPTGISCIEAFFQFYSELPQYFQHLRLTDHGFVFQGVPEAPLATGILAVHMNVMFLSACTMSSVYSPTPEYVLRTHLSTYANYLEANMSHARIRFQQALARSTDWMGGWPTREDLMRPIASVEMNAFPMCFFIYVGAHAAGPHEVGSVILPALEAMAPRWPVTRFFVDVFRRRHHR